MTQERTETVQSYLAALEQADLERLLALFSDGATIKSPLYGRVAAREFYSDLFADTESSSITLHDVFVAPGEAPKAAAHFDYRWQMKNGSVVEFECVDIFEFREGSAQIQQLSIIYDSGRTRGAFEELRSAA